MPGGGCEVHTRTSPDIDEAVAGPHSNPHDRSAVLGAMRVRGVPRLGEGGRDVRILVSADMEGATGVTWPADVEPGNPQWQRLRALLTGDVNAAVAGLCAGGADEVLVNDAHSTMRNLLLE